LLFQHNSDSSKYYLSQTYVSIDLRKDTDPDISKVEDVKKGLAVLKSH
jgi:hypothetical protein